MRMAFCIVALICFILATLPLAAPFEGRLIPIGLAFLTAALCLPI